MGRKVESQWWKVEGKKPEEQISGWKLFARGLRLS
jgi:hypothetical protein